VFVEFEGKKMSRKRQKEGKDVEEGEVTRVSFCFQFFSSKKVLNTLLQNPTTTQQVFFAKLQTLHISPHHATSTLLHNKTQHYKTLYHTP